MSCRRELLALLRCAPDAFRKQVDEFLADIDAALPQQPVPPVEKFAGPDNGPWASLLNRERQLVWKAWTLSASPFGVTVTGAAYEDNPILYANRQFRQLTGYSMTELRDENPRLLQGPDTEPAAVAELHAALRNWESTTVELHNYRADGTPFVNRVSLVPVTDAAGTVTNWLGVGRRVDG
ncbi:PAS domain-containing protein [Halosegnis sp.]|uniref:PAS domain-containing protein n=1 Tax=Halosegnis sp. TaxID=2864959 RepID=UPI0035D3EA32